MARILVALGGNALARAGGTGDWSEAVAQMRRTAQILARLAAEREELLITHGNGPQVGQLLRQNELSEREVPTRPLYVLGAETQGQVGYLVEQELTTALASVRCPRTVIAFVGRMVVSPKDPAFRRPTKPIGRYYPEPEAHLLRKSRGWSMAFDPARGGWRRLVASPRPLRWVEGDAVRRLIDRGLLGEVVPVINGGGGIPVVERRSGALEGVEAVIDKDLGAAVVARDAGCQTLAIVTDVPAVATGFGKRWERWLRSVSPAELTTFLRRGEFGEGSMAPKVRAALEFVRSGGGRAVITDIPSLERALSGEAGTTVMGVSAQRRRTAQPPN